MKPRIKMTSALQREIHRMNWTWMVVFSDGRAWFGMSPRQAWDCYTQFWGAPK